jgi:hypothetical protein
MAMRYLQVIKTPPSASAQVLIAGLAQGQEVTRFNLYEDQDYAKLVELIFSHEIVQSWW